MVPASWFDRASGFLSVRFGASPRKRPRSSPCPLCLTAQRSEQGKTRVAKSGSAAVVNLEDILKGRYGNSCMTLFCQKTSSKMRGMQVRTVDWAGVGMYQRRYWKHPRRLL